jgi:DNA invertase Pin-like site-specific DNA recombinase
MTKITPEHLTRGAYIYIRQSTADQLLHNHESRRSQYGLADRARHLGWQDVVVIDDDLGRSGSGISRPGFERLLAAICEGRVASVFAIEVSRLARNGRDWHTLIEFCGLVGTIIVDEDGVYDPRHPNDRLLLGMKGTMSELELSILAAPMKRFPAGHNQGGKSPVLTQAKSLCAEIWAPRLHQHCTNTSAVLP